MRNLLLIAAVLIIGVIIFMIMTSKSSSEQVNIRVKNATTKDIQNFWLGAGGLNGPSPMSLGAIKNNETTSYRGVDPILARYRKTDFITTDGKRYGDVVYPENFFDKPELEMGSYYTFEYTLQADKPVLKITRDK